jgi:hypothetical protein
MESILSTSTLRNAAGVIALEVARRLEDQGEVVGLILFDPRGVLRHNESLRISSIRLAQKDLYHLEKMPKVGASNVVGYVAARMKTQSGRVRRSLLDYWRRLLVFSGSELPAVLRNSQVLFSIALTYYRPKPYTGRIVTGGPTPRGRRPTLYQRNPCTIGS